MGCLIDPSLSIWRTQRRLDDMVVAVQQVGHGRLQGTGQRTQCPERGIGEASLDQGDVGPVKLAIEGQLALRPICLNSQLLVYAAYTPSILARHIDIVGSYANGSNE